jgi:hypothetical protein
VRSGIVEFTRRVPERAVQLVQLVGQQLRESEQDRELQLALLDEIVYQFFDVYVPGVTLCGMDDEMAFSVYLKVACAPILHTIGLKDLFQCDVLHLFLPLRIPPWLRSRKLHKLFNLSDLAAACQKYFFRGFLRIFARTPREGEIACPNNSGGDSSAGPARGYLDRGDLTAEKFAFVPPERLPRIALPVAYTIGFREPAKHLQEPYLKCLA